MTTVQFKLVSDIPDDWITIGINPWYEQMVFKRLVLYSNRLIAYSHVFHRYLLVPNIILAIM